MGPYFFITWIFTWLIWAYFGKTKDQRNAGSIIGLGIAFLTVFIGGIDIRCRDGWFSSNIGTHGACSWHGGVTYFLSNFQGIFLIIELSILISLGLLLLYNKRKSKGSG